MNDTQWIQWCETYIANRARSLDAWNKGSGIMVVRTQGLLIGECIELYKSSDGAIILKCYRKENKGDGTPDNRSIKVVTEKYARDKIIQWSMAATLGRIDMSQTIVCKQ